MTVPASERKTPARCHSSRPTLARVGTRKGGSSISSGTCSPRRTVRPSTQAASRLMTMLNRYSPTISIPWTGSAPHSPTGKRAPMIRV